MAKERLDAYMARTGLAESREKAQKLIMAGLVLVGTQRADKPSHPVKEGDEVHVKGQMPYVSRGGYKLKRAMDAFSLTLTDCVCADIGASSGGFTDCMLQHGARKVFAVDVGYGQLDYRLRSDPRVVVMERTNARYLSVEQLGEVLDFASIDVSFISLHLILPALLDCLKPQGRVAALIKPQFEAGKELVGKKGVVRDMAVHRMVIERVLEQARQMGYGVAGLDHSPIKGPEGNIEFLTLLVKGGTDDLPEGAAQAVVERAHASLK